MAPGSPLPAGSTYAAYCVRANGSCACLAQHAAAADCFLSLNIDGCTVWVVEVTYTYPLRPAKEWCTCAQLQLYAIEDDETVMASFSKLRDNRPDAFHSSRNGGKAGMQAALRDSAATGITFGWVPRAAGQSGATLDPTSLQWIAVKPAPPKPSKSRGI